MHAKIRQFMQNNIIENQNYFSVYCLIVAQINFLWWNEIVRKFLLSISIHCK